MEKRSMTQRLPRRQELTQEAVQSEGRGAVRGCVEVRPGCSERAVMTGGNNDHHSARVQTDRWQWGTTCFTGISDSVLVQLHRQGHRGSGGQVTMGFSSAGFTET